MNRGRLDAAAVDRDRVALGIDQKAGRGRAVTVDADRSRRDERVGGAAARYAGPRQKSI